MNLTIKDRFILMQMLPAAGTFSTIRTVDKVRKQLAASEIENKLYEIVSDEKEIKWNTRGDTEQIDIPISPEAFLLIINKFKEMDSAGTLPAPWLETCEKLDAIDKEPK